MADRYAHRPGIWGTWSYYQLGHLAGQDHAALLPAYELSDITISQTAECRDESHKEYSTGFRDGWYSVRRPTMAIVADAVVRTD